MNKPTLTQPSPEERAATLELVYLRDLLASLPPERRTAVDAGAHRGHFAAAVADLGFDVLALEPNPVTAAQFEQRQAGRGPAAGRVRLCRCAASDRNEWADLIVGSASTVCTIEPRWAAEGFPDEFRTPRTLRVPTRRLDALATAFGVDEVGLLKVDVEGHEAAALRGYFDRGELPAPAVVMFEAAEAFPDAAGECLQLLADQGYGTFDCVVRVGIGLEEVERFAGPQLPRAWRARTGGAFYANMIAYHPDLPAAALPEPRAFRDPWEHGQGAIAAAA